MKHFVGQIENFVIISVKGYVNGLKPVKVKMYRVVDILYKWILHEYILNLIQERAVWARTA